MRKRETRAGKEARHRFYEEVLSKGPCWFNSQMVDGNPCDGPMDPCHFLPKQRLKRIAKDRNYDERETLAMVWDSRNGVPGCRAHHHKVDNGFLRFTWDELPIETHGFAFAWDLEWEVQQMFRKEYA